MIDIDEYIETIYRHKDKIIELQSLENFSFEQIAEALRFFKVTPEVFSKIVDDDDFYRYLIEGFKHKAVEESEARGRLVFIDHFAEYIQLIKGA